MANVSFNNSTDQVILYNKITNNLNILVALSVTAFSIVIFTVLLSITLIIALCRYGKTSPNDNNITRHIVISMTVNDLLLCLLQSPHGIILLMTNGKWTLGMFVFQTWQVCSIFLSSVSASHIFSMALDKYLAICHPTKYRVLPDYTGYIMALLAWLSPAAVLLITYSLPGQGLMLQESVEHAADITNYINAKTYLNVGMIFVFSIVVIPISLTYILYVLIYIDVRKWIKRSTRSSPLKRNKKLPTSKGPNILSQLIYTISIKLVLSHFIESVHSTSSEAKSQPRISGRKNLKAIRTIASIVISYTVCWFPVVAMWSLKFQGYFLYIGTFLLLSWLSSLNCTSNLVLCLGVKFARTALRKLLS